MQIPLNDSTTLSYLAEFYMDLDETEKQEAIDVLSPEGKAVARAILSRPDASDPKEAAEVAVVLKQWGERTSKAR